jgi:hypothetical protein
VAFLGGTVAGSGEDKGRTVGGIGNRRRVAVVVAVLVAVLALARCGGDVVALGRTDLANSDQSFRNGSFLITVTEVAYGVRELAVGAVGQGFDEDQLPGTTHSGWFVFDMPESVTMPKTLNVQSDPQPGTSNPPTHVRFG